MQPNTGRQISTVVNHVDPEAASRGDKTLTDGKSIAKRLKEAVIL